MKKVVFVVSVFAMIFVLIACDASKTSEASPNNSLTNTSGISLNDLHTNSKQLVIKNNSTGMDTYTVYSLSGDSITGCKGYIFFPSYYSNSDIAAYCKSMNDMLKAYPNPYVKKYTQAGRTLVIEYNEKQWKGFTKSEMIASHAYSGGTVVY